MCHELELTQTMCVEAVYRDSFTVIPALLITFLMCLSILFIVAILVLKIRKEKLDYYWFAKRFFLIFSATGALFTVVTYAFALSLDYERVLSDARFINALSFGNAFLVSVLSMVIMFAYMLYKRKKR